MAKAIVKEKSSTKAEEWRERITAQERTSLSVKEFCKERGLAECSFYSWRKRLRDTEPVRFALVERAAQREGLSGGGIELVLASGERLLIRSGVDDVTLRTVLQALRA